MSQSRREKLLEFKIEEIDIGKCKFIETDSRSFEVCRGKSKIEIYELDVKL